MVLFESLMHRKSQYRHLWRQHLMVKYLEQTSICASQRPLVGRRCYRVKNYSLSSGAVKSNRQAFLTESLGIPLDYSRMKYYDEVDKTPLQNLKDALKILENEGIQKLDIYNNFQVLALLPVTIKYRSRCLKELGFSVDVPEIIKCRFLLNVSTEALHHYEILPQTVNPFENIMKNLDCSPQLQTKISAACKNPDQLPLQKLREKIIKCILFHYLGFINYETRALQFIIYNSCASDVQSIIQVYKELDFSMEFIQKHAVHLRRFPEDIRQIMKIAEESQLDLRHLVLKKPVILRKKPEEFALMCRYLFDFGISPAQIMCCPNIFTCNPQDVSNSLETISKWPEFPVLKFQKNFMLAVSNYRKANMHMLYLKKAGYERCNMSMLLSNDKAFTQQLYRGEGIKSCREIASYISTIMETPYSDVIAGLRHHPCFPDTSINNVKDVLTFLLAKGFTRTQIINGLALVLYPKVKVARAYKALPNLDIAKPYKVWEKNDNLLHLLLYVIEKGECIFLKPEQDMESTKLRAKKKQH